MTNDTIKLNLGYGDDSPFNTLDTYDIIGYLHLGNDRYMMLTTTRKQNHEDRILIVNTHHPQYKKGWVVISSKPRESEFVDRVRSTLDRAIGSTRKRPPREQSGTYDFALSIELSETLNLEGSPWILIRIFKDKLFVVSNGKRVFEYDPT